VLFFTIDSFGGFVLAFFVSLLLYMLLRSLRGWWKTVTGQPSVSLSANPIDQVEVEDPELLEEVWRAVFDPRPEHTPLRRRSSLRYPSPFHSQQDVPDVPLVPGGAGPDGGVGADPLFPGLGDGAPGSASAGPSRPPPPAPPAAGPPPVPPPAPAAVKDGLARKLKEEKADQRRSKKERAALLQRQREERLAAAGSRYQTRSHTRGSATP
jgi:hypothetical protein